MEKHKFTISISGSKKEATEKINALAVLAAHLSASTIKGFAKIVKTDPAKIEFAKHYLGIE
ncbi:MAG: hypothetical protein JKY09_07445 [Crocinitomicaceae bacterium]|nr:hypothetical protein [Crocinitomicaceae bacterium]